MKTWTFPANVKQALLRYDCLGFDYAWQAGQALLTHADWQERWDWSAISAKDMAIIATWISNVTNRNN